MAKLDLQKLRAVVDESAAEDASRAADAEVLAQKFLNAVPAVVRMHVLENGVNGNVRVGQLEIDSRTGRALDVGHRARDIVMHALGSAFVDWHDNEAVVNVKMLLSYAREATMPREDAREGK